MRSGRVPWRGVAREGCALLEVALPVLADRWLRPRARRRVMDRVVIGMDPHKASVTIEARDSREVLRARGRFGTDKRNYALMLRTARQWPDRLWAVEGANGIGRPIAQRLLADGERVLDVPAKLAARARVFDTGQGRKTDATDAHAIVMVALRDNGLRELTVDPELEVLRLLCDRRDELSRARVQALGRLHRLSPVPQRRAHRRRDRLSQPLRPELRGGDSCDATRPRCMKAAAAKRTCSLPVGGSVAVASQNHRPCA